MPDHDLRARIDAALALAQRARETGEARHEAMELLVRESREIRTALFADASADPSAVRRTWEPALNALTTAYYSLV